MSNIIVHKISETECFIETSSTITQELNRYFAVRATNYKWSPAYKMKKWDGYIRFFSEYTNKLPIGFCTKLKEFAEKLNYTIQFEFDNHKRIDRNDFVKFVKELNLPFLPRDYQLKAAYDAICCKNLNIASSTSSGKSLILYIITRWLIQNNKKLIIIVPSVMLVEQLFDDFIEYGWSDLEMYCSRIYSGKARQLEKPIQLSTWQSVYTDKELFQQYDAFIIDECHLASAKSLKEICQSCTNAQFRIGTSGSYPLENTAEWYTIVGNIGQIKTYSTYKMLQERNFITDIVINSVLIDYPLDIKLKNFNDNKKDYVKETDFVNKLPQRMEIILKIVKKIEGNTLILFTKKENHGYPLRDYLNEHLTGKHIVYLDGDSSPEYREQIRKEIETRDDMVILASYGIFSTGVNAPNISNALFASGYKSRVKVLQSLGRILRKKEGKEKAYLFDLVDDLSFNMKLDGKKVSYSNHAKNHYAERLAIYSAQHFQVQKYEIQVKK